MKYLPLILFALLALWPLVASAQGAANGGGKLFNLPAEPLPSEAPRNVSVGPQTLIAYYDEMELHFFFDKNQLWLIAFGNEGECAHRYAASIERISDHVYRADISGSAWVEVNTATGITIVHEECISRVYLPATKRQSQP